MVFAMLEALKSIYILILLPLVLLGVSGCAVVHHYSPYLGKVVDVDTGEPIEGAAVLAIYYTQSYGLGGSGSDFLDAQETITNKSGEFKVSSLTSLTFRPLQTFEPWAWITVYKPGYAGYGCLWRHEKVEPSRRPFPPNNHIIVKLPELKTKEERLKYVNCNPYNVPKKKYPSLLRLINSENFCLGIDLISDNEK